MIDNARDTAPASACGSCGGACESQRIALTLRRAASAFVLIRDVPAEVCQECGETFFSLWTAKQLMGALQLQHAPDSMAVMPIYDYPLAG